GVSLYRLRETTELIAPTVVVAFDGWVDAGGAATAAAELLARVGRALGLFIQVNDDMGDAMAAPAGADWQRRRNNLAIHYALTADHAEREQFAALSARADDPEALDAAQKVLVRSGALSFCTLKLIELSREIQELLARVALKDPAPLNRIVETHRKPLHRLLEKAGVDQPAVLVGC
ncbi:MAG: hypothetical protein ACREMY_18525, partial [bacterium]